MFNLFRPIRPFWQASTTWLLPALVLPLLKYEHPEPDIRFLQYKRDMNDRSMKP